MSDVFITKVPEWNKCLNLLLDPKVSEIQANGPGQFFAKRAGKRIKIDGLSMMSEKEYFDGIEYGLAPFVKSQNTFSRDSFIFEGRLEYTIGDIDVRGRCHIVLPPATDYPQVTIAKKTTSLLSLDKIAAAGSMSEEMRKFLELAVRGNATIVFSGASGAGKTTMLEAVAKNIDPMYRIGIAEDTPELILSQPNTTYLHSTPWSPGMNPNDVATLDWVVAQFMRNRCDKMIIGETRGKEFSGFLTASNSGMEGGMTTIHAEDPTSCLRKMTSFTTEAKPGVPVRAINMDIATAIQIVVQLIILPGGKHRVSHIEEITQTLGNTEDAQISTQPLYLYDRNTDSFYKAGNMSDSLRSYFTARGQDVTPFLRSEINKKVKATSSSNSGGSDSGIPHRTLPTPTSQDISRDQGQRGLGRRLPNRSNPFGSEGKRRI